MKWLALYIAILVAFISCEDIGVVPPSRVAPWAPIRAISIQNNANLEVEFLAFCEVPNACSEFVGAVMVQESTSVRVKIAAAPNTPYPCAQVLTTIEVPITALVTRSGLTTFRFWQSDSTSLDTTFVVF